MDIDFTSFNRTIKNIAKLDENSLVKQEDLIIVNGEIFNLHVDEEF